MSQTYSSVVRSRTMFLCIVLNVLILTAGSQIKKYDRSPNSEKTSLQGPLSAANTKFALDLYKHLAVSKGKNIFMSPLSISVAMAMTYLGARGQTKSQMSNVLHFSDVEEDHLHQTFADIQSALNKPKQAYKLLVANRLFGGKSDNFLQEFLDAGQQYYGAALKPVDFGNSKEAAALINKWTAEKTNNKVKEIVSAESLDDTTSLVLVNAIYFKGSWLTKFDAMCTKDADFHISPEESVNVKMMYRKASFFHGWNRELKCQVIELPYTGESLSMFILLPEKSATSLSEVERKLLADYRYVLRARDAFRMRKRNVRLWLPRFSLDEELSLKGKLAEMGMSDLFGKADLSGMDGTKKLFVSKALHRAVVEVNEEGTEAAAVTAVVASGRSMSLTRSPEFRVDHPFIFFIQDKTTGSILFLGRMVNPST